MSAGAKVVREHRKPLYHTVSRSTPLELVRLFTFTTAEAELLIVVATAA